MCAKIKICLEKIRKEVFRTGSMFMSNVMSVYFSNVIRRNRGGVSAGLTTLSFVYGLSCALQFCGGKTAVTGREGFGTGSRYLSFVYGLTCALQFCGGKTADGLFVADKFNFSDFFTETELYKQKRTRSFCLLGRRSASFLCLNEFFREPVIPNVFRNPTQRRLYVWGRFGIFPKGDLTLGNTSGFSRMLHKL